MSVAGGRSNRGTAKQESSTVEMSSLQVSLRLDFLSVIRNAWHECQSLADPAKKQTKLMCQG
jgi:hypothetical protein